MMGIWKKKIDVGDCPMSLRGASSDVAISGLSLISRSKVLWDCPGNYRRAERVVDSGLSRSRGFTLLEVLVSLAIIAFALTAILQTQFYNLKVCAGSKNILIARMLTQKKMAEIELSDDLKAEEGVFPENKDFSYAVNFNDVQENLKEINLKVIYKEGNLVKDFSVSTYLLYKGSGLNI